MAGLDHRIEPWLNWLESARAGSTLYVFLKTVVASFLTIAGYFECDAVRRHVMERLDDVDNFARKRGFQIFVDSDTYGRMPASYRKDGLIDAELYPHGQMRLPWIHDAYAFANIPPSALDEFTTEKLGRFVDCILDGRYQQLPPGYGVVSEGGRFMKMGWDAKLPGFGKSRFTEMHGGLVQRVELMSHFPAACAHAWFQDALEFLETFETARGTYAFPRAILRDQPKGYWVNAARMGIEEDRRRPLALELESTFWMLKIRKNTGLNA
jgi:hypothetical protein